MKKILILMIAIFAIGINLQAQDIIVTTASDTSEFVIPVGNATTVTIKADVVPLVSSATTSDTILVFRYLKLPGEAPHFLAGDTIIVTNATPNTTVKTYSSNYFSYYKFETRTASTSTSTLNVTIKAQ